jgi:ATP:cob(I)alamin adenosyltransferase
MQIMSNQTKVRHCYFTGRGDEGSTYLANKKILKSNSVINALGGLDELSAVLGHIHSLLQKDDKLRSLLEVVEYDLYLISATVSVYSKLIKKENSGEGSLAFSKRVKFLEETIDLYSQNLDYKAKFVFPNGSPFRQ